MGGSGFPLFKIIDRPLLPVQGSWIDSTPFIAMFVLLGAAAYFAYRGKRVQVARRAIQVFSAFFFIIFIHRCLCALRGWAFGMQLLGRNNLLAFGDLCIIVALVAFTAAFGRLFCGWVCPLALIQEVISKPARVRMSLTDKKSRNLIGFLLLVGVTILIGWLAYLVRPGTQFFVENVAAIWTIGLLVLLFWAIPRQSNDLRLRHARYVSAGAYLLLAMAGVFVTNPWCTLFGDELDYSSIVSLLGVIAAALVVPLAWCRYVCPGAGSLAPVAFLSPYRIRNSQECNHCRECEAFCPTGALGPEQIDDSACIYCGNCLDKCGFHWEKPKAAPRQ